MRRGYLTPPVIIILGLICFFVGAALFANTRLFPKPKTQPVSSTSPSPKPNQDEAANWETYTSPDKVYSFKYPSDWNIADKSSITNGVPPELSKVVTQGDKPALISILKFNSADFRPENLNDFAPFAYKVFEKDQSTFVLISYTYQIGANAPKETKQLAIDTLEKISSTFKFLN